MPDSGPRLRTDLIDAYLFRRCKGAVELLQLKRSPQAEFAPSSWQPVMGHIREGETAAETAVREIAEETRLQQPDYLSFWQLQQVYPYYISRLNAIMLTPRFAVEALPDWTPKLNAEHTEFRFINLKDPSWPEYMAWIGQRQAVAEMLEWIIHGSQDQRDRLAVDL